MISWRPTIEWVSTVGNSSRQRGPAGVFPSRHKEEPRQMEEHWRRKTQRINPVQHAAMSVDQRASVFDPRSRLIADMMRPPENPVRVITDAMAVKKKRGEENVTGEGKPLV